MGRKKENAGFENYRIWRNLIYEKLLKNESIIGYIVKWSVTHPFPFKIVSIYQTIIKNMEKRTVEKIIQLADFIVRNRDDDFIKRSIKRLNGEKSSQGLRLFLLRLNEQNYQQEAEEPLITVKDYTEYLFPDGSNWREVRDVLLIAIYQNLHEINMVVEVEPIEEETETITENE